MMASSSSGERSSTSPPQRAPTAAARNPSAGVVPLNAVANVLTVSSADESTPSPRTVQQATITPLSDSDRESSGENLFRYLVFHQMFFAGERTVRSNMSSEKATGGGGEQKAKGSGGDSGSDTKKQLVNG